MAMPEDYINAVLRYYDRSKNKEGFPPVLLNPSPAGLKSFCLVKANSDLTLSDISILNQFLEIDGNAESIREKLKREDRDKFKPIQKFIKKDTRSPSIIVVTMLAWLMGFPYQFNDKRINFAELYTGENTDETAASGFTPIDVSDGNKKSVEKKKGWVLAVVILLGAFLAIIKELNFGTEGKPISLGSSSQCLRWTGFEYEIVRCQDFESASVIHYDEKLLKEFKRISRPDTITEASIGKLYYISYNNNPQFYTSAGSFPEEPHRKVRPLSRWIFEKYILPMKR